MSDHFLTIGRIRVGDGTDGIDSEFILHNFEVSIFDQGFITSHVMCLRYSDWYSYIREPDLNVAMHDELVKVGNVVLRAIRHMGYQGQFKILVGVRIHHTDVRLECAAIGDEHG